MGLGRPSAIRHPKGLWLIKTWQGQAFKANTTKLRKNVKPRLQKKPAFRIAARPGHLFQNYESIHNYVDIEGKIPLSIPLQREEFPFLAKRV
jgi:hypothetical protein